jgi:tetratricopeptide (TPR) repeat protein
MRSRGDAGKWRWSAYPACEGKSRPRKRAFIQAQALAGLGRLDEAIKILKPFADGQNMPAWLYWGRIGDVYYAAQKYELIVPAAEKAAELAPDNPTVLLDLAMALVRYRQDAVRARKLLLQARTHALSDVLAIFADLIEGMIELESGNPSQARHLFDKTLSALAPFRNATPLIGAAIDRTYACLALAYAATGDRDQAERYYRRAEPRLRALKSHDLIDRCESALELKPAPA